MPAPAMAGADPEPAKHQADRSHAMNSRRPPLADLRVFEAAARHLSFTRAGAELGVTQGAISQRIRHLEDFLGLRLFERLTRALVLTSHGRLLAVAVGDGLARIDEGVAEIGRASCRERV